MGDRVAHLVTGRMLDFIEFDDGFAIVKTRPPRGLRGMPLGGSASAQEYGVTVVGREAARRGLHPRPPRRS